MKEFVKQFYEKLECGVLTLVLIFTMPCLAIGAQEVPDELNNLYARSAVLMDGDSGRILFGKEETQVLPMASTTKIMTCIIALEEGGEEDVCDVSEQAQRQPKVHLGMQQGEQYYLKDLLYSMMLESHNDSAVCVAERVGGSVEQFAELMNQKARAIGCAQTHFVTPNGLDSEDKEGVHSTTAVDLAKILRYCILESPKKGQFLEVTQTTSYSFQDVAKKRSFSCTNHNALLQMLDGAVSGKTGFTGNAGYCYVGAVKRDDTTLIVALLACGWPNNRGYKWRDTKKMMEYGFAHYQKKTIKPAQIKLPTVSIIGGISEKAGLYMAETKPFSLLLHEKEQVRVETKIKHSQTAPVKADTQAGSWTCFINDIPYKEIPILYQDDIECLTYLYCLKQTISQFLFY